MTSGLPPQAAPPQRHPSRAPVTVAIPTFGRDEVLTETIRQLLDQRPAAAEILVIDQTPRHEDGAERRLAAWHEQGAIRWLRIERPSVTSAMNRALLEAANPLVLFVDDDIIPASGLVAAHVAAMSESEEVWAVTGQVLQPGEEPASAPARREARGLRADLDFPFWSTARAPARNVMAGNLCVRRDRALAVGGFDENYKGVAYRFETDFARRVWQAGGRILFEPAASIRHLRAGRGGTRRFGNHLSSPSPAHGVGDYYFALRHGAPLEALAYVLRRPFREVRTRFHLTHPWFIPVKLLGEAMALAWGLGLWARGPALLSAGKGSR
ncbi:MAG TPA: glycosyltransferase [Candidatus Brocadiia bacterium]|nr:glycosyltransferase [Candidatus Brocadiia bacterium]